MTWTKTQVLAASDAWRWVPPGAESFEVDGVQVVDYPDWAFTPFYVTPLATGRRISKVPALIDAVSDAGRERGKPKATWWISPSTRPARFGDALLAAGATLTDTCDIHAFDLTHRLPDVGEIDGITTELVSDERTLDDYTFVGDAVWGTVDADDDRRAAQLAEVAVPVGEQQGCRVIGYADGEPVAMGGLEVVDGVARLYGAATLESARGRGAYRAVLLHRLRVARDELAATLALVHAKVGTSGPIVQQCGFTAYGRAYSYDLELN